MCVCQPSGRTHTPFLIRYIEEQKGKDVHSSLSSLSLSLFSSFSSLFFLDHLPATAARLFSQQELNSKAQGPFSSLAVQPAV
jgi:hypothetical protein